ncbi:MAG: hypothetical protein FJ265_09135 [Planctomycetes bacterium]|nr:hypothetical protein [Planctomycetota bacterium]
MENNIFLRPAVAGLMRDGFVEARHHTDIQLTLTPEQLAANRKLRDEIAATAATPYYVVVDPKTGQKIGEHALSGGPNAWEGNWLEFLRTTLQAAGRPVPGEK